MPARSSSNCIAFNFLSSSFQLPPLQPVLRISLRGRTELLEVHTFSHWFGTFITFIGWEAITSVRRTWCVVTSERASSVCVRKVHLLLVINVCGTVWKTGTLHFYVSTVNVSVYWSECTCYTVRKCTSSIKANAVTLYACDTGCPCFECMQKLHFSDVSLSFLPI